MGHFEFSKSKFIFLSLTILTLFGCNKKTSTDENSLTEGGTISTKMIAPASTTLNSFNKLNLLNQIGILTPATLGQTSTSSITSLKYFILSVTICKEITTDGTGFSAYSGCLDLYKSVDLTNYDTYAVQEAQADEDPTHYIDFMTEEGRAHFNQSITYTSENIGTYNWVLVNYARPIKITGSFIVPGTTTAAFVTKTPMESELVTKTIDGRKVQLVRLDANPTSGIPTELTYMLNNGGTFFPLLKPLTITESDVQNKTAIKMDFVFNPEQFATAYSSTCDGSYYYNSEYNAVSYIANTSGMGTCTYFDLPYAKMGAVPHKEGETIKKEVYHFDMAQDIKMRMEIYYNSSDSTKAVLGADSAIEYSGSSLTSTYANTISLLKASQSGNTLTFQGYNQTTKQIDTDNFSFTRGANGTAVLTCINSGGICSTIGETHNVTYTYDGDVTVN